MITYWGTERRFVDDHSQAIRFVDPPSEKRQKELHVPNDSKVKQTWCNKCSCWHLTLEASAQIIASGVAKKEQEDVSAK